MAGKFSELIYDRIEGKAKQEIDHTSLGEKIDNTIKVEIIKSDNENSD